MRLLLLSLSAILSGSTAFQVSPLNGSKLIPPSVGTTSRNIKHTLNSSPNSNNQETEGTVCDVPIDVDLSPTLSSSAPLRSALLTNADNERILLNEKMGSGTSILIFLRHMG